MTPGGRAGGEPSHRINPLPLHSGGAGGGARVREQRDTANENGRRVYRVTIPVVADDVPEATEGGSGATRRDPEGGPRVELWPASSRCTLGKSTTPTRAGLRNEGGPRGGSLDGRPAVPSGRKNWKTGGGRRSGCRGSPASREPDASVFRSFGREGLRRS